jgi:hypothetical protein
LTFYNLRSSENLENTVGDEEKEKIWIPRLIFDNSVEENLVENDHFSSLALKQSSPGIHRLNEFLQEEVQFKGSENFLIYLRTYKMDLFCEFEERIYPFDIQTCSIKVRIFSLILTSPNLTYGIPYKHLVFLSTSKV